MTSTEPTAVQWEAWLPASWTLAGVLAAVHAATAWVGVQNQFVARLVEGLATDRSQAFRIAVGGQYHPAIQGGEWWRLATSVLLHGDGLHLVVNMVAVVVLGRVLEPWLGPTRLVAWFCAGGIAGSVASHVVGQLQSDGASGGAFALLGAAAVVATRLGDDLLAEDRQVLVPMLWAFLVLNVALSFSLPFVDAAGHLGGLALGMAMGLIGTRGKDHTAVKATEAVVIAAFTAVCLWGWFG